MFNESNKAKEQKTNIMITMCNLIHVSKVQTELYLLGLKLVGHRYFPTFYCRYEMWFKP